MKTLNSAISVKIDSYDKEIANGILKKIRIRHEHIC